MAARTLYLTSSATASPFPTTSRLLATSANASEVTLGPGEFDNGLPGNSDAGQWNPNSALADTTAAAEIDNTGANPGTTRQGWLFNTDLAGQTLARGAWTIQLRLRANQGTGLTGFICARVSIVTGSAGAWTTVKQIFVTTRITGATSTTAGQAGWRDQNNAAITVTSTAANFSVTIGADDATTQGHTFATGERILVELGFCNGNNATDRTWRLDYNTANSFITTPDISVPARDGDLAESHAAQTAALVGASTVSASSASAVSAQTETVGAAAVVAASAASASAAQTETSTGEVADPPSDDRDGTLAETSAAQTEAAAVGVAVVAGAAEASAEQTGSAAGGVATVAASASATAPQAGSAAATVVVTATAAEATVEQTGASAGGATVGATSAGTQPAQASSVAASVSVQGLTEEEHAAQVASALGGVAVSAAAAGTVVASLDAAAGVALASGSIVGSHGAQAGSAGGDVVIVSSVATISPAQTESIEETSAPREGALGEQGASQVCAAVGSVAITASAGASHRAQTGAVIGTAEGEPSTPHACRTLPRMQITRVVDDSVEWDEEPLA